jgi:homoserine dehydrogenase
MLQGDAIREITLFGPGAGGIETASAVIADMVSVVGTTGNGFLENDACWRTLERMPPGDRRSPNYIHIEVDDRPGVLAHVAERLAAHEVSVARLIQHPINGTAGLHVLTHEARSGSIADALAEIAALPETQGHPTVLPVISDRGVPGLGWV